MAMGMTYQEFWYDDPHMTRTFLRANKIRQKQRNEGYWLQGMYIYNALCVSLWNAFRKKGRKAEQYPEKPYDIFPKTKAQIEAEKQKQLNKFVASLNAMKKAYDARGKGQGNGSNN